ncbi:ankyrin [Choiromyces venosus 120613-1]|uniref:Ankyrin n=1 Tax=Choiromyces venosus 120613-1 TaxID=1336337 RepID=A0A3N4JKQ7_9PEZI|nr:ankyrin [Choiromyces venosus 120613-1]
MEFLDLPNETILLIAEELTPPDTNSLLQTNNRLAALLAPDLIDRVCRDGPLSYCIAALRSAAGRGDKAIISRILTRGSLQPNAIGDIVKESIETGDETAFLALLDSGTDPDVMDSEHRRPLTTAAGHGHLEMVERLMHCSGVNINAEDQKRKTAISLAVQWGNTEIVRLLLNDSRIKLDPVDFQERTLPIGGQIRCHRLLLKDGRIDINATDVRGKTALNIAARRHGREDEFKMLPSHEGVDVNLAILRSLTCSTPLHALAEWGNADMMKLLLMNSEVDTNRFDAFGRAPLFAASSLGHMSSVRLLMARRGVHPDIKYSSGRTPLHAAASRRFEEVGILLAEDPRVDVNSLDDGDDAPLHMACSYKYPLENLVRALPACSDINLDITNVYSESVRMLADNYHPVISKLIKEYLSNEGSKSEADKLPTVAANKS